MSLNFEDPTTWDQPLADSDAISLGIWALNTLMHPEGSTGQQFEALDALGERALKQLSQMRSTFQSAEEFGVALEEELNSIPDMQWVVETIYNTDAKGARVADDDYSNRTLHGPFTEEEGKKFLEEFLADDTDVKEMEMLYVNKPETD